MTVHKHIAVNSFATCGDANDNRVRPRRYAAVLDGGGAMGMRMTRLMTVLLVAAMLHVNISAQRGYETFNRALAAEKTDGDLRGAIRLYEQAIREAAGKDRQLAARALLRV